MDVLIEFKNFEELMVFVVLVDMKEIVTEFLHQMVLKILSKQ